MYPLEIRNQLYISQSFSHAQGYLLPDPDPALHFPVPHLLPLRHAHVTPLRNCLSQFSLLRARVPSSPSITTFPSPSSSSPLSRSGIPPSGTGYLPPYPNPCYPFLPLLPLRHALGTFSRIRIQICISPIWGSCSFPSFATPFAICSSTISFSSELVKCSFPEVMMLVYTFILLLILLLFFFALSADNIKNYRILENVNHCNAMQCIVTSWRAGHSGNCKVCLSEGGYALYYRKAAPANTRVNGWDKSPEWLSNAVIKSCCSCLQNDCFGSTLSNSFAQMPIKNREKPWK